MRATRWAACGGSATGRRCPSRAPPSQAGRFRREDAMALAYTPAPHSTQHWSLAKPAARGRRGMVAAQSKAAAEAGVAILDAGGSAADAAVATAFALATLEPWNSGL